ncbi:phosphate signaling complex protein PhoU [Olsenella sp. HMSC062G07]|uniref:phosphate signaling complex protein PhoU n=1 Tax=Olsenella sp. HMSC062G07 TaxID=1739330 RepID=UPI0008A2147C|nr:phosphate signaling complex protein PhoU [Olsenella sp. HMSC062G07]OFK23174.1 hypothetical protein HMPREF2826_00425 [Olsenella sp. HMSC062G07]
MRTRTSYLKQLDKLGRHVAALGKGVVDSIRDTGFAISEGNEEAAQEVIDGHSVSEHLHRSIEDSCMNIMLLQSPMASDLRMVTATFRAISDLARIEEMAYETALLSQETDLTLAPAFAQQLGDMSQRAATMLERAMEAFNSSDVEGAESVFLMDDAVDKIFDAVRADIITLLRQGDDAATIAPELLTIAKYYERMGDHAQSICDWAIFRATGEYRGRFMVEEE